MNGLFIAFEGIEGSGKSTQVDLLAVRLRAAGREVVQVREPGGTPLAEEARRVVLHEPIDITPASELFLYQAARADLVARVIRPALEAGRIVVADRFELSTRAYQGAGRGLPADQVTQAIALAVGNVRPDLYIVLDVDVAAGRARQAAQGKRADRIERADDAFHQRVADSFRAARDANVTHLRGDGAPAEVGEAVWRALTARFPQLG